MDNSVIKFTPYEISLCLYDQERTEFFSKALNKIIKSGDIVVDAGSGTGVLGLLAAKCGALKVYCIELSERFCKVIENNAKNNGLEDRIIVICGDATKVQLPEKVDVIVSEVISGGFFFEPQIQIINHLRNFLKEDGKVIPKTIHTYVELINGQEDLYGLKFNFDSRSIPLNDKPLTDKKLVLSSDFTKFVSPEIHFQAELTGILDRKCNAIRISYAVSLTDELIMKKPTESLLKPEIIYIQQPLEIEKGERYSLEMEYTAATDTLNAYINLKHL